MFEKSPQVAPLLVRLYDSYRLYGRVKDDSQPQAQAELADAVSDLLEINLNIREQELLADVLIGLVRQAELDLKKALAEKMAHAENAPLRLVLFLANEEISVATPVLRHSVVLSDLDLVYIIKSQGAAYWREIAVRENLSPQIVDVLVGTNDAGTAVALTGNERARLTEHAFAVLAEQAKTNENLARPLLQRPEMPPALAKALYGYVGEELRSYIKGYFGAPEEGRVMKAVDETVAAFVSGKASEGFMPTEDMLAAARKAAETGALSTQYMMGILEGGDIARFVAMFSVYTGLSARHIHDTLSLKMPRNFAVACRAFGIQKGDFTQIYLFTHKMRSADRRVEHKDMATILDYFDRVRPEAALKIIGVKTL